MRNAIVVSPQQICLRGVRGAYYVPGHTEVKNHRVCVLSHFPFAYSSYTESYVDEMHLILKAAHMSYVNMLLVHVDHSSLDLIDRLAVSERHRSLRTVWLLTVSNSVVREKIENYGLRKCTVLEVRESFAPVALGLIAHNFAEKGNLFVPDHVCQIYPNRVRSPVETDEPLFASSRR